MARILKVMMDGCLIECVVCANDKEVEQYIADTKLGEQTFEPSTYACYSCIEEIKATTDLDVDSMDIQEYILQNEVL